MRSVRTAMVALDVEYQRARSIRAEETQPHKETPEEFRMNPDPAFKIKLRFEISAANIRKMHEKVVSGKMGDEEIVVVSKDFYLYDTEE